MVGLPKNLNELKALANKAKLAEVLDKVKTTLDEALKPIAQATSADDKLAQIEHLIVKYQALQQQQAQILQQLQAEVEVLKAAMPAMVVNATSASDPVATTDSNIQPEDKA